MKLTITNTMMDLGLISNKLIDFKLKNLLLNDAHFLCTNIIERISICSLLKTIN